MVKRLEQRHRLGLPAEVVDRQPHEHHDEHQLGHDQHPIDPGNRLDTHQIQRRHQGNGAQYPYGGGHGRKVFGQVDADQQIAEQRQEDVVQQQGPAGDKAEGGAKRLARIGVDRARIRVRLDHAPIAVGRQQHGSQGQQVGGGQVPLGHLGHQTVGGEHRQRHHIRQPEQYKPDKAQGLSKAAR